MNNEVDVWNELERDAWTSWARESWLPINAAGLQREPLGKAREEESEDEGEESWKKSSVPFRQAWI